MKRVKSAAIFQTLVFSQLPDKGFSKEQALMVNRKEVEHYKEKLERSKTRYQITDLTEQQDGSIVVCVKKQYNDKTDSSEYFD